MDFNKKINFFDKVKKGDIITCRGENNLGKIIRWITNSNYNHSALYIGEQEVIEALSNGIVISDINERLDNPKEEVYIDRVKNFDISKINELIDYSKTFLHTKYDWIGLLGIATKYIVRKCHLDKLITFWGRNKIENQRKLWCSEFCGVVFSKFNIKFTDDDTSYLTPNEIHSSSEIINIPF